MVKIDAKLIKRLREKTGAGIVECKQALVKTKGEMKKAEEILAEAGLAKAAKKTGRETGDGRVISYTHHSGKVGALVSLGCETDFVARTDDFAKLGIEIAMQVAAMNPKDADELMAQAYIRDGGKTIEDLLKEHIAKLGENIVVLAFARQEI